MKAVVDDKAMGMGKIASKLSEVEESEPDMEDEGGEVSPEEVLAMKAFERAGSPEAKVEAFKNLVKMCGGY